MVQPDRTTGFITLYDTEVHRTKIVELRWLSYGAAVMADKCVSALIQQIRIGALLKKRREHMAKDITIRLVKKVNQ